MSASRRVQDGWYIDELPPAACVQWGSLAAFSYGTVLAEGAGTPQDRVTVKRLGMAPLGFPIEETDRH